MITDLVPKKESILEKRLALIDKWLEEGKITQEDRREFFSTITINEDVTNGLCPCGQEDPVFCPTCSRKFDDLCAVCGKEVFEDRDEISINKLNIEEKAHVSCIEKACA